MNVLVTGGAGYIGSHAALRLLEDGHTVTLVDDFSRGNRGAVAALRDVGPLHLVEGDFGDRSAMTEAMELHDIDLVMHFAAWTYVGESVEQPLRYYHNNVANMLSLLHVMHETGVRRMVFSSSAATYGAPLPEHVPILESCPQDAINPYGCSKLWGERILFDYALAQRTRGEDFAFAALRYFNVAGSDPQGRIGEDHDPETHIIPICLDAGIGKREHVTIMGTDYDTPDGTCVRDYVHVSDLADAHVTVMHALEPGDTRTYNIGIGRGYSVRDVVVASRNVTGVDIQAIEGERRPGDPPTLYTDPAKINRELGWSASFTDLERIIETAWKWWQAHPAGYEGKAEKPKRRNAEI